MSNLKHEMKIDAFNSCKDEDGKLPETVFLHFFMSVFKNTNVIGDKTVEWGKAFLPKFDP